MKSAMLQVEPAGRRCSDVRPDAPTQSGGSHPPRRRSARTRGREARQCGSNHVLQSHAAASGPDSERRH
eukprot:1644007-Rhodomonas_salina.1